MVSLVQRARKVGKKFLSLFRRRKKDEEEELRRRRARKTVIDIPPPPVKPAPVVVREPTFQQIARGEVRRGAFGQFVKVEPKPKLVLPVRREVRVTPTRVPRKPTPRVRVIIKRPTLAPPKPVTEAIKEAVAPVKRKVVPVVRRIDVALAGFLPGGPAPAEVRRERERRLREAREIKKRLSEAKVKVEKVPPPPVTVTPKVKPLRPPVRKPKVELPRYEELAVPGPVVGLTPFERIVRMPPVEKKPKIEKPIVIEPVRAVPPEVLEPKKEVVTNVARLLGEPKRPPTRLEKQQVMLGELNTKSQNLERRGESLVSELTLLNKEADNIVTWTKDREKDIETRRGRLDTRDGVAVANFNEFIKQSESEQTKRRNQYGTKRSNYNKRIGLLDTEILTHEKGVEEFNKPIEERREKMIEAQKKIEEEDKKIQDKYFEDVVTYPGGLIPGMTTMPIVESKRKDEWYSPFVPEIVEDINFRKDIKERNKLVSDYMEKFFPVEANILFERITKPDPELYRVNTSKIAKISSAIDKGDFKITSVNVKDVEKAFMESNVDLAIALDKGTSYEYYRNVPVDVFVAKKIDKQIADSLSGQLNDFYAKEAAKTAGIYLGSTVLTAGLSSAMPLLQKVPGVGNMAYKALASKPGQGIVFGAYASTIGYRGYKDVKEGDILGLSKLGAEALGVASGVQLVRGTAGKPWRAVTGPITRRTAFAEFETGPGAEFFRVVSGKKSKFTGPEFSPIRLEVSSFPQRTLSGFPIKTSTDIRRELGELIGRRLMFQRKKDLTGIEKRKLMELESQISSRNKDLVSLLKLSPSTKITGEIEYLTTRPYDIPGVLGKIGDIKIDRYVQSKLLDREIKAINLAKPGQKGVEVATNQRGDLFVFDQNLNTFVEYNPKKWSLKYVDKSKYGIEELLSFNQRRDLNFQKIRSVYTSPDGNIRIQTVGGSVGPSRQTTLLPKEKSKAEMAKDSPYNRQLLANIEKLEKERIVEIKKFALESKTKKKVIKPLKQGQFRELTETEKLQIAKGGPTGQRLLAELQKYDQYGLSGDRLRQAILNPQQIFGPRIRITGAPRPGELPPTITVLTKPPAVAFPAALPTSLKQFPQYQFIRPTPALAQEARIRELTRFGRAVPETRFLADIATYTGPAVSEVPIQTIRAVSDGGFATLPKLGIPIAPIVTPGVAALAGLGLIRPLRGVPLPPVMIGRLPFGKGVGRRGRRGVRGWTVTNPLRYLAGEFFDKQRAKSIKSKLTGTMGLITEKKIGDLI